MYLVGQGHEHLGPGTSMVQFIDWREPQERQMLTAFPGGVSGLAGCCPPGLGACSCGGACDTCSGGLGLFESMDFSTWSWPEWAIVGLGVWAVGSMLFTGSRGVARVRAIPGERRRRRAAEYRRRAAELEKR